MFTKKMFSSFICVSIICIIVVDSMQVIPERINVVELNPKYISWGRFNVRRYGRKSKYYMNLEGAIKHNWSNNVTLELIFMEYLHNEYRRSFVEMKYKLCDLLNEDYVGGMFNAAGLKGCPMLAGEYHLMNMSIPSQHFPNVFPFEKARIQGRFRLTDTGEVMTDANIDCLFKQ